MTNVLTRVKQELVGIIPTAVFFLIAFHLLALTQSLILKQYGLEPTTIVAATIGALIVAKVVMVVDMLPVVNQFPHKPLIYNVMWKTVIYLFAALLVRYVEHLFHFYRKYHDLGLANEHLLDEVVWPHFWVVQLWLFVLFLMYCSFRELVRVLGRERVRAMFLGPVEPGKA